MNSTLPTHCTRIQPSRVRTRSAGQLDWPRLAEDGSRVDQILDGKARVHEPLDVLDAPALLVAPHACRVVRHRVDHLPVRVREVHVVDEEIGVAVHVGHHQLLIDEGVSLEQVGVGGIVVDHHLVDLVEPVLVAFRQLGVFHAPAPVRVARGKPAVGGERVHLPPVDHLEDDAEERQPHLAGDLLDPLLLALQHGGQRARHRATARARGSL